MKQAKNIKFGFYLITGIILTLGLSISLQSLLAAWTPPTAVPPGSNTQPPINEGSADQAKLGGLSIGGGFAVDGNVGIGLAGAPTVALEVNGNIIADDPVDDNHVATKGWVMANAGGGGGVTMLSAESGSTMSSYDAAEYCWNLSASAEYAMNADTSTYTDWRLPSAEELGIFIGLSSDNSYLLTTTGSQNNDEYVVMLSLSAGTRWFKTYYYSTQKVRCVR